ncbi:MAG TPA: response regulator transcription factor [Pyrinomonadaceae bacterium]|nr:response regulator transcription factor [Pyrinomonadaceae bacterium]
MKNKNKIRILTVDDHPLMREGIAAIINNEDDMEVVGEVSNAVEAAKTYAKLLPDVTLMDLRLPDGSGIDVMIEIIAEFPEAKIILLTMFDGDAEIQRALKAGARAYLLKSMPSQDLLHAIRRVYNGKKHIPQDVAENLAEHLGEETLTPREIEVLQYVAKGKRNREIGEKLFITEETVKVHIKHIMEKLYASDRTQAVSIAIRRGIIQL